MGFKKTLYRAGRTLSKNSPTILTGLSVGGLFTTAILAVKVTPKAIILLNEHAQKIDPEYTYEDLEIKEIVKVAWKCYIPSIIIGVGSASCIIAANHVNLRRNAALAGLYSVTETAFKEYQNKVVQTIGQNKERKVRDEINADRVRNNPPSRNEVIMTGEGDVLCYDKMFDRYFKTSIDKINKIVNKLNRDMRSEHFISLNDFYFEINPSLANGSLGDEIGWCIDHGYIEPSFSSCLSEDDKPCLVIDFELRPKHMD